MVIKNNKLTNEEIKQLSTIEGTKKLVNVRLQMPFFIFTEKETYDSHNDPRYYVKPVLHDGKTFYITAQLVREMKEATLQIIYSKDLSPKDIRDLYLCNQSQPQANSQHATQPIVEDLRKQFNAQDIAYNALVWAIANGKLTDKQLSYLLSKNSAKEFKTGGYPLLITKRTKRYKKEPIQYAGRIYYICSQLYNKKPDSFTPLVKYLNKLGITDSQIQEICTSNLLK